MVLGTCVELPRAKLLKCEDAPLAHRAALPNTPFQAPWVLGQGGGGGLLTKLCPTLAISWYVACQAPLSMGFFRQEYWSGLPFPSPGDLPHPGIEPRSPALQADSLSTELQGGEGRPREGHGLPPPHHTPGGPQGGCDLGQRTSEVPLEGSW